MNAHWFLSLDDARAKMEEWPRDYNEVRPNSAIGNKPPISLLNAPGAIRPLLSVNDRKIPSRVVQDRGAAQSPESGLRSPAERAMPRD